MNIKYIDRRTGEVVTENPPAEKWMRFIYQNPVGRSILLPMLKRKWVSSFYGKRMDRPASTNKINNFVLSQQIDMSESLRPVGEFSSFNDFFARKLKPDARPIESGFVSPGDGKLIAFEKVSDLDSFFVKGQEFSLTHFLQDEVLAEQYMEASLMILRLAPNDYHRFHFPWEGVAGALNNIKGAYFSVSPIALIRDFVQVFTENKRAYCTLETRDKGSILLAPVGATMVGSIVTTYEAGTVVQKGEEMGYFVFGGSSIVILVDPRQVKIDEDILQNTKNGMETAVRMGEKIGV